jgi:hypothetical protein
MYSIVFSHKPRIVMEKFGSVWFFRDFAEPRTELLVQLNQLGGYA